VVEFEDSSSADAGPEGESGMTWKQSAMLVGAAIRRG
jgi:hypothetical protein